MVLSPPRLAAPPAMAAICSAWAFISPVISLIWSCSSGMLAMKSMSQASLIASPFLPMALACVAALPGLPSNVFSRPSTVVIAAYPPPRSFA